MTDRLMEDINEWIQRWDGEHTIRHGELKNIILRERERMVLKLENYCPTRAEQLENPLLTLGETSAIMYAIKVVRGEDEEDE